MKRLTFRKRDITAAIEAVEAAGQKVARIEVNRDGGFVIFPGDPGSPTLDRERRIIERIRRGRHERTAAKDDKT